MNARVVNLECALGPVRNGIKAEELAVTGTVVSPTALHSAVKYCWVSVKTKAVLVTFDDTDPATATQAGVLLAVGYEKEWSRRTVECAKFVEAASGQAGVVRFEPMSE